MRKARRCIFRYVVDPTRLEYSGARMAETRDRIAKTLEKLRSGRLPAFASSGHNLFLQSTHGTECSGCDDLIVPGQSYYSIRLRDGKYMLLRFHPVCYELWVRFEAASRIPATTT
jgi:hypothetical protein